MSPEADVQDAAIALTPDREIVIKRTLRCAARTHLRGVDRPEALAALVRTERLHHHGPRDGLAAGRHVASHRALAGRRERLVYRHVADEGPSRRCTRRP
jgi:hypothetical protein